MKTGARGFERRSSAADVDFVRGEPKRDCRRGKQFPAGGEGRLSGSRAELYRSAQRPALERLGRRTFAAPLPARGHGAARGGRRSPPQAEMGVRNCRRLARLHAADGDGRTALLRQPNRQGLFARRQHRLHLLGDRCWRAGARGNHPWQRRGRLARLFRRCSRRGPCRGRRHREDAVDDPCRLPCRGADHRHPAARRDNAVRAGVVERRVESDERAICLLQLPRQHRRLAGLDRKAAYGSPTPSPRNPRSSRPTAPASTGAGHRAPRSGRRRPSTPRKTRSM